jgi:hypothetical protein
MSILKNANYLLELDRIPCAVPDMLIIIKTGLAAAPPALLTLFLPGCNEIVKTRIGNSPWHLRGMNALIKGAIKPYPISEQKFLYKIGYYAAEKYLWWWMVADVTTEFVTTWQSMVYQEQQCELPGAGTAYGYFEAFVVPPNFSTFIPWTPSNFHPGVQYTSGGVGILPGYEATIAFDMTWDTFPVRGEGASVETSLLDVSADQFQDTMNTMGPNTPYPFWTGGSTYHKEAPGITPAIYRVFAKNTGPKHAQIVSSSFSIGLTGRRQGNLTFGCRPKPVEWPFPNPLA